MKEFYQKLGRILSHLFVNKIEFVVSQLISKIMTSYLESLTCSSCNKLYDEEVKVEHCHKSNCNIKLHLVITPFTCENCTKEMCNACIYYTNRSESKPLDKIVCKDCFFIENK